VIEEFPDLEVEMRIRNNQMKARRLKMGLTQAEAIKACGTCYGPLETMRHSPLDSKGEWRVPAIRIAEFFGELPETIWPNALLSVSRNKVIRHFDADKYAIAEENRRLLEAPPPDEVVAANEIKEALRQISTLILSPRQQKILSMLYGLDGEGRRTQKEVGEVLGITGSRVGGLEADALRKIRRAKTCHSKLREPPDPEPQSAAAIRRRKGPLNGQWTFESDRFWEPTAFCRAIEHNFRWRREGPFRLDPGQVRHILKPGGSASYLTRVRTRANV